MIVVDNSLVVKWFFEERHKPQADAVLLRAIASGENVLAPRLLPFEFVNTLHQRARRGLLQSTVSEVLEAFFDTPIDYLPRREAASRRLLRRSLQIAYDYSLPASYDAQYVALAEALRCDLWTADERLLAALAGRLAFVRPLAEYHDPDP